MLEVYDSVEIHTENVNDMDYRIQYLNSIEDFQLKSTLPVKKKSEELQLNKQSFDNENCMMAACLASLKKLDNNFFVRQYKSELLLQGNYPENSTNKTSLDKAYKVEITNSSASNSSNWRRHWEMKCREWLYRDNFNIEVLNFAKRLYFP